MMHARKQQFGTLRAPRGFAPVGTLRASRGFAPVGTLRASRGFALRGAVAALAALLLLAPLATPGVAETDSAPAAVAAVDINAASADQLMSLPGIGASKAEAIVKYRDEHGPYHAPEDLLEVKGIGESLLRKIQPHITTGGTKANR